MANETQLTFYVCKTKYCDFFDIPYQIREDLNVDKPKHDEALKCSGCGKARKRDKTTTVVE